ncbi:MAG TPA: response regulator [Limnobacter sp.]|nr:response regulator [Limnobacter sp.]
MVDVILVDDNSNDADLALRVVRKTSSTSTTVLLEDGERAIEYFRQLMDDHPSDSAALNLPKLVLLDLKLPKLDGLEVLSFLRSKEVFRTMPVVVLSSSREISDVKRAYELGVNSFAVKPVQFDQYLARISALVSYWLTINELPRGA